MMVSEWWGGGGGPFHPDILRIMNFKGNYFHA